MKEMFNVYNTTQFTCKFLLYWLLESGEITEGEKAQQAEELTRRPFKEDGSCLAKKKKQKQIKKTSQKVKTILAMPTGAKIFKTFVCVAFCNLYSKPFFTNTEFAKICYKTTLCYLKTTIFFQFQVFKNVLLPEISLLCSNISY